jgi:hypothetical protein
MECGGAYDSNRRKNEKGAAPARFLKSLERIVDGVFSLKMQI